MYTDTSVSAVRLSSLLCNPFVHFKAQIIIAMFMHAWVLSKFYYVNYATRLVSCFRPYNSICSRIQLSYAKLNMYCLIHSKPRSKNSTNIAALNIKMRDLVTVHYRITYINLIIVINNICLVFIGSTFMLLVVIMGLYGIW